MTVLDGWDYPAHEWCSPGQAIHGLALAEAIDRLAAEAGVTDAGETARSGGVWASFAAWRLDRPAAPRDFVLVKHGTDELMEISADGSLVEHPSSVLVVGEIAAKSADAANRFTAAVRPIFDALRAGDLVAVGSPLGSGDGSPEEPISAEFWHRERWRLDRVHNRIVVLPDHGGRTEYKFISLVLWDREAIPVGAPASGAKWQTERPIPPDEPTPVRVRTDLTQSAPAEPDAGARGMITAPLKGETLSSASPLARTGAPGRPSLMDLVVPELRRRHEQGELLPSLAAESKALSEWMRRVHDRRLTAKAIENAQRNLYRSLKYTPPE